MRDFFIYSAESLAQAGNGAVSVRTNVDSDADFEVYSQAGTAISTLARLTQFEATSGRTLQDVPVPWAGVVGDGRRPFHLPVTKRLKRGSTFLTTFVDESGSTNEFRLAYIGAKIFKQAPFARPEYVAREYFAYSAPFVSAAVDPAGVGTIAAGGTLPFAIRITEDADFEIRKISLIGNLTVPAASSSVGLMSLEDSTYNYRFMDRPIALESLGYSVATDANRSGFWPFVLREPKLMRRGSLLTVTVQNLDAANALSLRVTLHGSKCYPTPGT
jgi:hypothetical protein